LGDERDVREGGGRRGEERETARGKEREREVWREGEGERGTEGRRKRYRGKEREVQREGERGTGRVQHGECRASHHHLHHHHHYHHHHHHHHHQRVRETWMDSPPSENKTTRGEFA
jgi:hypothetical protein